MSWLPLMPIDAHASPGRCRCLQRGCVSPTRLRRGAWRAGGRAPRRARAARTSAAVYQRPWSTRMSISGRSAVPQAATSLPPTLALVLSHGWMRRDARRLVIRTRVGVGVERRACATVPAIQTSKCAVVEVLARGRCRPRRRARAARAASPTASATCSAVASVRRLRRADAAQPDLGAARQERDAAQQRVERAPGRRPPSRSPAAPRATGSRAARRIAGSAASGGPTSPTTRLATRTAGSTCRSRRRCRRTGWRSTPRQHVGEHDAQRDADDGRRARRASARCAGRCARSGGGCRRSPSSRRSRRSARRSASLIVFDSSTSADSSASSVTTVRMLAICSKPSLPG